MGKASLDHHGPRNHNRITLRLNMVFFKASPSIAKLPLPMKKLSAKSFESLQADY